jgi:hypothetical protein
MLDSRLILIVEEGGYAAMNLSDAIEESKGRVAGPVTTLSEAQDLLDTKEIGGAIVDCELAEAAAVVLLLVERAVPLIAQVTTEMPQPLNGESDRMGTLVRPVDPRLVLDSLLVEIGRSEMRTPNMLGTGPKQV